MYFLIHEIVPPELWFAFPFVISICAAHIFRIAHKAVNNFRRSVENAKSSIEQLRNVEIQDEPAGDHTFNIIRERLLRWLAINKVEGIKVPPKWAEYELIVLVLVAILLFINSSLMYLVDRLDVRDVEGIKEYIEFGIFLGHVVANFGGMVYFSLLSRSRWNEFRIGVIRANEEFDRDLRDALDMAGNPDDGEVSGDDEHGTMNVLKRIIAKLWNGPSEN